jgi:hypothetical protein
MAQPVRVKDDAKKWFDATTARYFCPATARPEDEVLLLTVRGQFVLSQPIAGSSARDYSRVNARRAKQWLSDNGFAADFMDYMETFDPTDEI